LFLLEMTSQGNAQAAPPDVRKISDANEASLAYRLSFASENVQRLSEDDFDIDAPGYITLKKNRGNDGCTLILFYIENNESLALARVWSLVAQQVAGPKFAAINMITEKKVAQAFTAVGTLGAHPYHWASLRQYPFVLVYRDNIPVAGYNGALSVQPLVDFSLTLACKAGYYEPFQLAGSAEANVTAAIATPDIYDYSRKGSQEFQTDQPVRSYVQPGGGPAPGTGGPASVAPLNPPNRPEAPSGQGLRPRGPRGGAGTGA
jgi:hypothetical protein